MPAAKLEELGTQLAGTRNVYVPEPLGDRGNKQAPPRPWQPYQGSLQEEYGSHTPLLLGCQPSVPTAATEPTCGLWVQVELGVKGAILPALSLLREVLLQGRIQGLRVVLLSLLCKWPLPVSQLGPLPRLPHPLQEGEGLLLLAQLLAQFLVIPEAHTHPASPAA